MVTLYRTDKSIIGEFPVDSVKEAVEFAVKQSISLEGANLKGVDLTGIDLEGADLEGADLEGAILEGSNLEGVNLMWANLMWAKLVWANFKWANLEGVNLKGAVLTGANFKWATLDFAAVSLQYTSTEARIDDRFVAQLVYLLTRQDHSNCSEEVRKEIEQIKSMNLTNLLAKYKDDIKLI